MSDQNDRAVLSSDCPLCDRHVIFNSRQLRAFHLVAQHQSFARAAEKLFLTPSGVSVLMRELERQLGFRLFDRTTRQVELTAYGSRLLAVTQPSVKNIDAAMPGIEQAARGRTRSVSIGTTPWLAANRSAAGDSGISRPPTRSAYPTVRRQSEYSLTARCRR
jgi:DNA-binding CsgD family transcriptional regulator